MLDPFPLLENYFEMSHVDAETALDVYQRFCRQTEKVVDYLSVAKKLENLLNVPIPNLKHVSGDAIPYSRNHVDGAVTRPRYHW